MKYFMNVHFHQISSFLFCYYSLFHKEIIFLVIIIYEKAYKKEINQNSCRFILPKVIKMIYKNFLILYDL